ncbi:MAG TPA: hypothetical protein VI758_08200 [Bacteroidota bacterium]
MGWLDEVEKELGRAREAQRLGNAGRVRTAARRAVGLAVTEYQQRISEKQYGGDFMRQVRGIAEDTSLPEEVRSAAKRLQSRIAEDFTSASRQPLADAQTIIDFIQRALTS